MPLATRSSLRIPQSTTSILPARLQGSARRWVSTRQTNGRLKLHAPGAGRSQCRARGKTASIDFGRTSVCSGSEKERPKTKTGGLPGFFGGHESGSEFEDGVDRKHFCIGPEGTVWSGGDACAVDLAEVFVLDAEAVLPSEKILDPEAGQQTGSVTYVADKIISNDEVRIVDSCPCLGKEGSQAAVKREVIGEMNRWQSREPPARYFVVVLLSDICKRVFVLKFADGGIAHLCSPVPVDLVTDKSLETGVEILLALDEQSSRAEIRRKELNPGVADSQTRVPVGVLRISGASARQQQCCDRATQSRVFHQAGPFLPLNAQNQSENRVLAIPRHCNPRGKLVSSQDFGQPM